MNDNHALYRITELINNTVNPAKTRKKLMEKLQISSRTTFWRKCNATSIDGNRFTTLAEEAIAAELNVDVQELFTPILAEA